MKRSRRSSDSSRPPPKMYLARPSSRAGPKTPVLAVGESSFQTAGRLDGWRGFFTPSKPRVTREGGTSELGTCLLVV